MIVRGFEPEILNPHFPELIGLKIDHTFLKEKPYSKLCNFIPTEATLHAYRYYLFHTKRSVEPRNLPLSAQTLRARTRHETSTKSNHLNFFSIRNLRRNLPPTSFVYLVEQTRGYYPLISTILKPSNQGSVFIYPLNSQFRTQSFVHIPRLIHHNRFNSN